MQENVTIRKFKEDDIVNKVRWINDSANNQYLHYELPLEVEKTQAWFKNNQDRTDRYDAVIEYNGIPVGVIGLLSIADGRAEYYVTLGESEFKGKGIAKRATVLLLEYAFSELSLEEVYLYTEVENIAAQALFDKSGFKKQGVEKDSAVNRGKLVDRYYYSVSKAEFQERGCW